MENKKKDFELLFADAKNSENLEEFQKLWGGISVYIPQVDKNKLIYTMYLNGSEIRKIAKEHQVTMAHVYRIIKNKTKAK